MFLPPPPSSPIHSDHYLVISCGDTGPRSQELNRFQFWFALGGVKRKINRVLTNGTKDAQSERQGRAMTGVVPEGP